ncbi:MAG: PIN domain-containing protein [Bacillota bacterium]
MKGARVLDANILLLFLTNDLPEQAERCAQLLKRAEANREQVLLPDLVPADVVWTLEKFYRSKARIRELLTAIVNLRGLRLSSKKVAREALRLYAEENLDWTDAFVAAQMLSHSRTEICYIDALARLV